ncbi:ASC-1-like (ASCH) protein [Virgibacillus natechei]|uniref:ASC-1-like (ASCH) protein n=1 Tax=Virgibacillus natechei TaxID=1216297 RepID=A0ABS4IKJ8_9BACI|nr:ASCH domain-containing protein [Virgibacillus natechei]MBP1970539.1 ASC-1-like (ASCH) protein [Virgibacillus natechei]UZD14058.1 ASCH domain-containing protein [Virgibacillus natechei]
MLHKMGLYNGPFQSIKSGRKTVEVRLNDEKRRKLTRGDVIVFTRIPERDEVLTVEVLALRKYDTFRQMYEEIPAEDMDEEGRSIDEMVKNTFKIYTPDQEKEWGTLAITIKVQGGDF